MGAGVRRQRARVQCGMLGRVHFEFGSRWRCQPDAQRVQLTSHLGSGTSDGQLGRSRGKRSLCNGARGRLHVQLQATNVGRPDQSPSAISCAKNWRRTTHDSRLTHSRTHSRLTDSETAKPWAAALRGRSPQGRRSGRSDDAGRRGRQREIWQNSAPQPMAGACASPERACQSRHWVGLGPKSSGAWQCPAGEG